MFDDQTYLFASSTRLVGDQYQHTVQYPKVYRYTINVLAGLQQVAARDSLPWDISTLIEAYLARHLERDQNVANRGLLLHILATAEHDQAAVLFDWLFQRLGNQEHNWKYTIQDLSWAAWGTTTYAVKTGKALVYQRARELIEMLITQFMHPQTFFPFHHRGFRGGFISFGGIAYFLAALAHFACQFDDDPVRSVCCQAMHRVIARQGVGGEWAWFFNAYTAKVMDWYPIYSVHQDAMALLFLLPAQDWNVSGAETAIQKSLDWFKGYPMIQTQPFFIHRSLRRQARWQRPVRLVRALGHTIRGTEDVLVSPSQRVIHPECCSYHLGWLLYVWSGRTDFSHFTELRGIP